MSRKKKIWILGTIAFILFIAYSPIHILMGTNTTTLFVEDDSHSLENQFRRHKHTEFKGWKVGLGFEGKKNWFQTIDGTKVEESSFINLGVYSTSTYKVSWNHISGGDTAVVYFESEGSVWGIGHPNARRNFINEGIEKFIKTETLELLTKDETKLR